MAYVRFNVTHLDGSDFEIKRPNFCPEVWRSESYTGWFRLNGDTKAKAVERLLEMAEGGLDLDEIVEPSITAFRNGQHGPVGENPCFKMVGSGGVNSVL
jgi:hypothetical protein